MDKDLEHPTEMHALSQTIFVGALVKENPEANELTKLHCSMEQTTVVGTSETAKPAKPKLPKEMF